MESFNIVYKGKELEIAMKINNKEEIMNERDSETSSKGGKNSMDRKET